MDWLARGIGLRIGGHRGAPDVAPENTIVGFEAAEETGVEYLENDIHRTSDGVLVVIHDETVNRTTNGRGKVSDMTLEQVRALDAGSRFGAAFEGERVPTFEEFMEWI